MAGEGGWDEAGAAGFGDRKLKNTLPVYGNKGSMNINSMILTNILGSPYFKEELINYKTFHEVVDEIYYKVDHLEPWEKNSRKLAGQVGMCAGVRGVAAGGIVSTAFCLLYKLFTLKLTRKQLTAMINHRDSPYIRGIGFLYIRYCQPPADFWDWFSPYLDDEEEIDLKAGSGYSVKIGEVCRMMLSKLDWFGTLFPRLPVNTQKNLEAKLKEFKIASRMAEDIDKSNGLGGQDNGAAAQDDWGEAGRRAREDIRNTLPVRDRSRERSRSRSRSRDRLKRRSRSHSRDRQRRSRSKERRQSRSHSRDRLKRRSRSHSRDRQRRSRSRDRDRPRRSRSRDQQQRRSRSKDRDRPRRSRSRGQQQRRSHSRDRRRRSRSKDRLPRSRDRARSRSPRRRRSRDRQRSRSLSRDKLRAKSHSRERARKSHRSRSSSREARGSERSNRQNHSKERRR